MVRSFDVAAVRADFPILGRTVHGRPLVYLDSAATAQKPKRVVEAMSAFYYGSNANIHRGAHYLSDESTAAYEAARETVRTFIGADSREEIIFTSGATASINMAARGLCGLLVREGDNIVVSQMEHHSNIVPWQVATACLVNGLKTPEKGVAGAAPVGEDVVPGIEIRMLPIADDGSLRLDLLETLIDDRTRILAISQCSNVLGTRPDIARAAAIAHRHGVAVVVDGCQGVVHGGANVREMDCDFYAFSGHKLYGPTGIGVLYGKKSFLERIPPYFGGGDMVKTVSFGRTTFSELPFKFEAGTSNFVGAIGLAEAIRYLDGFESGVVESHERGLLEAATDLLSAIPGLRIYGTTEGKAPIVSFTIEGVHAYDLGVLLDGQGVAVRTGTHCAQPVVDHYNAGPMCRASFAIYNTLAEVESFAGCVKKAIDMIKK
jgi:cysteine desulfurase/selenocysteine lyase